MKEKKLNKIKKTLNPLLSYIVPVLAIAVLISIVIVIFYNVKNNKHFLCSGITDILTLIIALIFAYYYGKKNNENQKKKEIIEKIIDKVQNIIKDDEIYNINSKTFESRLSLNTKIRKINNNISYLKNFSKYFCYSCEIKIVTEEFMKYRKELDTIEEDRDYEDKRFNNLKRILDLIDDKLEEIKVNLYK